MLGYLEHRAKHRDGIVCQSLVPRPVCDSLISDSSRLRKIGVLPFAHDAGQFAVAEQYVVLVVELETPPVHVR